MALEHGLGYKPSTTDSRDFKYAMAPRIVVPPITDLGKLFPAHRDQGKLGSCTWESMVAFLEFVQPKNTRLSMSVLFGYYNTRVYENTPGEDSGCMPRDVFKVAMSQGDCASKFWPYYISRYTHKPTAKAYANAFVQLKAYHALNGVNDIRTVLATGQPVYIGFNVYESFENIDATGIMPMPKPYEQILGGHAVVIIGHNDNTRYFKVRNSWSAHWGYKGDFFMPFSFVTNNDVSDQWALTF